YMKAITRAKDIGVDVAWSNPSFELWYLLHFEYRNTGIDRDEAKKRLNQLFGKEYQKNDKTLFSVLEPKVKDAIRNANRLLKEAGKEPKSAQMNPATNVVKLVEKLLEYEREK
ncbi:MAG: RloB domain-containing protein, partial [Ignavibacteria bacterium]|nr:RloB domain-containing protein [Ignavibacteria bacterium]